MASITLCPRCSSHLELPTGIAPTSLVECPICEAEFLLASVAPRAIPKVRVVEHEPTPEGKATTAGLSPKLGIVVDDAETSTEDKLSRLMRSAASWQLPGVHQPHDEDVAAAEEAETDDEEHSSLNLETADERIIPNDHAPAAAKFGATLDAAYRDADPELAADPSTPADELQLAGSRLDQLLSDLMKPQTVAASLPAATPVHAREEAPSSPEFAEFVEDAAEEETTRFAPPATVQDADAEDHSDSFDDRWRRLHASPEQAAAAAEDDDVEYVDEEAAAEDEFAALDLRTTPRRKRRPSAVRTLVGIVGGGAIGILGGAYALLWLRGPDLDLMGMANWLPPVMLPSSMQTPTESSLAEQGLLAPPAAVDQQAAGNGFETPAPPLSSTLEIAEPTDQAGAGPTNDQVVDATEVGSSPAPPAEHDPIRQDPDFMPAGATEPVADAGVAPTVENAVAQSPVTATTHWPTTPIVGQLRGAKFYSVAELDATLPGADAAHRRFLAGDLARKEDVAAMGQAYIELCKLAEQFTLTNPAEYGNELITKQMNAKNIFRGAVGDPARRNDLAMIAGRWLQHNRRPNQGVVVLGKVTNLEAHGSWTEYTIETPLGDATATSKVLLEGVPFASGSDVAVVGTIVADPRQAIDGYAGEAPQVIVAGFAFAPENFVAPKVGGVSSEAGDLFSLGE